MRRRDFLKVMAANIAGLGFATQAMARISVIHRDIQTENFDSHIKDYLYKMKNFNQYHVGDRYLDPKKHHLLKSTLRRLKNLQRTVGHGNFHVLSFDDSLKIARNYTRVGRFTKAELDFLEMIFYKDAGLYGFFGEKTLRNLTDSIQRQKVAKVPNTGNYLYKGLPLETYKKIKSDLGDKVILTSGIRSVIKQFLLFLNKAYDSKGNLSMSSRSLAPPGYSFHGIGDFDVGQVGYGALNFTYRFTETDVCHKLEDLGYINLRYRKNNLLGVRFEPWHIKVNFQA